MSDIEAARAAKKKLRLRLDGNPRIVGIGIAKRNDSYVVKVNLSEPDSSLPARVDRVKIECEVVGAIRARTPRAPRPLTPPRARTRTRTVTPP